MRTVALPLSHDLNVHKIHEASGFHNSAAGKNRVYLTRTGLSSCATVSSVLIALFNGLVLLFDFLQAILVLWWNSPLTLGPFSVSCLCLWICFYCISLLCALRV
jgi:hypothetical protein